MKHHATNVARTQKETDRLRDEISSLESELKSTGSTKTADEVEAELDAVAGDLYALPCNLPLFRWMASYFRRRTNDKEKGNLMTERERQNNAQRTYENDLHRLEMKESNLKNQIHDKDTLEASIDAMKNDIASSNARLKVTEIFQISTNATIETFIIGFGCQNWRSKSSDRSARSRLQASAERPQCQDYRSPALVAKLEYERRQA
jgi:DNA repair protein RAD50